MGHPCQSVWASASSRVQPWDLGLKSEDAANRVATVVGTGLSFGSVEWGRAGFEILLGFGVFQFSASSPLLNADECRGVGV